MGEVGTVVDVLVRIEKKKDKDGNEKEKRSYMYRVEWSETMIDESNMRLWNRIKLHWRKRRLGPIPYCCLTQAGSLRQLVLDTPSD